MDDRAVFAGRPADDQYYDMDRVVARALTVFEQEVIRESSSLRSRGDAQPKSAVA